MLPGKRLSDRLWGMRKLVAGNRRVMVIILAGLLLGANALADDWPQWRGPDREGVWREKGIVRKFARAQLPIRWRAKISNGYSGPTVADGRVYITDRLTEPNQVERVHCFDAMTGEHKWSHTYECKYRKVGHPDGPRASVTIDNGRAYSLGTMGHLFCFDTANGGVLWSRDLNAEYQIKLPIWGIAAAPLVDDGLLIVQAGGRDNACVIAFDKIAGKEKWRALNDGASYSAPLVIEKAGKRVLICLTADRLVGLEPTTGKLYWQQPFKSIQNVATPVVYEDFVFVSSFFDGSMLVRLDNEKTEASLIWRRKGESEKRTDSLHCCTSTPILEGDYIYGVDSYGELRCLDLHTGDRIWESLDAVPRARWANIHFIRHQDNVWMFNEQGELIISRLSPEGFHEISRAKLIEPTPGQLSRDGGVCWSHPAFAYRHVYVRNDKELVCADLSAKD
ncbi:MAG: PQQ-binding-like beta-propeller repeat protein [Planctomycetota bacterium]